MTSTTLKSNFGGPAGGEALSRASPPIVMPTACGFVYGGYFSKLDYIWRAIANVIFIEHFSASCHIACNVGIAMVNVLVNCVISRANAGH